MRRLAAWGAVLLAAAFLAWAAWPFVSGGRAGADDGARGRERDLVLRTGTQEVATLNSMDARNVEGGLQAWLNASTGQLHDRLRADLPASRKKLRASRATAAATVLAAAVTDLDSATGGARIIASVQITLTTAKGGTALQRKRYEAGLARTPAGWRLSSLTLVPSGGRA
ncbi:hypothetical protein [Actinomadura parmotrematis]|nr:hypothetical protein [Actinomadura parmotrematis]